MVVGMREIWERMSLRRKVPLIFCGLLFVTIVTVGAVLLLYYNNVFKEYFRKSFDVMIRANAGSVGEILDGMVTSVNMVNDNEEAYITNDAKNMQSLIYLIVNTVPALDGSNLLEIRDGILSGRNSLDQLLYRASSYGLVVRDVFPMSRYFREWKSCGQSNLYCDQGLEGVEWYEETMKRKGEVYWFTQEDVPNHLFMAKQLTYRYYNRTLNEYEVRELGAMYAGIDMTSMEIWMDLSEMPENVEIVILDDRRGILYFNREDVELLKEDKLDTVLEHAGESAAFYDDGTGGEFLLQKNEVAHELYLLTAIPADTIERKSLEMLSVLLALLVVALVAGMILISIVSRSVTMPIKHLTEQMRLGIVELVEDEASGQNEIGILYQGYNQMQRKMQEMLRDVWESAQQQKEAELRALQAQINPHFIYNTMGTISCEALLRGEDVIAKQLNMLANIMRYSTKEPDSLVPLRKEIQIIRQYAAIQLLSREGRLEFTYDIDPACEEILIPKLMIQPLVENAIIHGIDSSREDGSVHICARMEEGKVVIMVADNGVGGNMAKINQYIHGEQDSNKVCDSIGVRNVYERICGVYGENGSLMYQRAGERTEVVITITMGT